MVALLFILLKERTTKLQVNKKANPTQQIFENECDDRTD